MPGCPTPQPLSCTETGWSASASYRQQPLQQQSAFTEHSAGPLLGASPLNKPRIEHGKCVVNIRPKGIVKSRSLGKLGFAFETWARQGDIIHVLTGASLCMVCTTLMLQGEGKAVQWQTCHCKMDVETHLANCRPLCCSFAPLRWRASLGCVICFGYSEHEQHAELRHAKWKPKAPTIRASSLPLKQSPHG